MSSNHHPSRPSPIAHRPLRPFFRPVFRSPTNPPTILLLRLLLLFLLLLLSSSHPPPVQPSPPAHSVLFSLPPSRSISTALHSFGAGSDASWFIVRAEQANQADRTERLSARNHHAGSTRPHSSSQNLRRIAVDCCSFLTRPALRLSLILILTHIHRYPRESPRVTVGGMHA